MINDAVGLGDYWPRSPGSTLDVSRSIVEVAETYIKEVRDGSFVNKVLRIRTARQD